jgi:electron transfer flavoprotein beta subunit
VTVVAFLKWVDARAEVDRLTGAVVTDPRTSGASDADLAALEWALRLGEARGEDVVAVNAGPSASERMLRDALAAGAARAVRVDLPPDAPSADVAAALADVARRQPSLSFVVCGAFSVDRGSGSVPGFVAAHLDAAQALGCVTLDIDATAVTAERRLDGGRRERVRAAGPAVLSVEGGSARLRRASLRAVVTAHDAVVDVVRPVAPPARDAAVAVRRAPFRPRPRVLPPPARQLSPRERILALTGAMVERDPPQLLVLDPDAAADRILDQLRAWGYLG